MEVWREVISILKFIFVFFVVIEVLYHLMCGHKACHDDNFSSGFLKADRENRFSFEAFDILLQTLQGRRCCSHCILLHKMRLGTLLRQRHQHGMTR